MKNQMYFLFSFFFVLLSSSLLCYGSVMAQNSSHGNTSISFHVGVVLDLETWVGKTSMSCISMAINDFYTIHHNYSTRLVLHTRDSKTNVVAAASAAMELLKNVEAQAIIGPQTSEQAQFVTHLGDEVHVPILSFSATSLSLSSARTPYFIRTALNDSSQAKAIAAVVQAYGWMEVVPIYEDSDYGNGLMPYLTSAFQETRARFPYTSVVSPLGTDDQLMVELYRLMAMQVRVFVVHASASLGSRIFLKAKEVGMMSQGYVWIVTEELMSLFDVMDSSVVDSMQGVIGVKPYIPKSERLDNFTSRWKREFRWENLKVKRVELSVYGLWAYDTVWALAMAAESVGTMNSHLVDHTTLRAFKTGPKLRNAIFTTEFKHGLSGEFRLFDGQLQPLAFEIVNVVGRGAREIGYWTKNYGISRDVNNAKGGTSAASMVDLRPVIWPGDSTILPKGWVTTESGKKLRIGVPVNREYTQLVSVGKDPQTNSTIVSGFCIELFETVMDLLPFAVPYELVPFESSTEKTGRYYDELVHQVYLQRYDAAVGDIEITAERSKYVDFTVPFSEPGVAMLAPIDIDERKNGWIFMKPLTVNLWLASVTAFLFTGFVVWVLEHRINRDFRGTSAEQLGTIVWFSFSTLVFAHREKVFSNLARIVVVIWVFVVLILSSSYTASLSSFLTVQSLRPTVADIDELRKNGDYVGGGSELAISFLNSLNFDASKIVSYESAEAYLNNKSRVAAYFDEITFIKFAIAKYCSKYTMVRSAYRAGGLGFGFVFPKGSPLVPYLSRTILNLTESYKIAEIEKRWIGRQTTCQEEGENSNSLTLTSFRGLFLVTGVTSSSALFAFLAIFLYKNRQVFTETKRPFFQNLVTMIKRFDEKDLSSRAFRKNEHDRSASTFVPTEEPTQIT